MMKSELTHQIYAHRGYHDKPSIPENSLPAFRRAVARGWGAELDVHLLKDGTLAVFHDSSLERCTGVKGIIEDLDLASLKTLRLEGTDETIPLFDEVLELFEDTTPLIIELKPVHGNHKALAESVCKRLDHYRGVFCIESFDPRVLLAVRRLRPEITLGQLSQDFITSPDGVSPLLRRPLANMWLNRLTHPDFIAYRFSDRHRSALRKPVNSGKVQEVLWTIRSKQDFDTALQDGAVPIFEKFDPEV